MKLYRYKKLVGALKSKLKNTTNEQHNIPSISIN